MYKDFEQEFKLSTEKLDFYLVKKLRKLIDDRILKLFLKDSFEIKKPLSIKLGLGTDHRLVFNTSNLDLSSREDSLIYKLKTFIKDHVTGINYSYQSLDEIISSGYVKDKYGRGISVSKYINISSYESVRNSYANSLGFGSFNDFISVCMDQSWCLGFSVHITANPVDFLFCSIPSSFESCFSLNGDRRGSILSYMQNPHAFMIFLTRNSEFNPFPFIKDGRCWGFFPSDNHLIFGKSYGKINYFTNSIYRYLNDKLNLGLDFVYNDVVYDEDSLYYVEHDREQFRFPAWFDKEISLLATKNKSGRYYLPKLEFSHPRCLYCDDSLITSHPPTYSCWNCYNTNDVCAKCSRIVNKYNLLNGICCNCKVTDNFINHRFVVVS